jgi:hypothetical protein
VLELGARENGTGTGFRCLKDHKSDVHLCSSVVL